MQIRKSSLSLEIGLPQKLSFAPQVLGLRLRRLGNETFALNESATKLRITKVLFTHRLPVPLYEEKNVIAFTCSCAVITPYE